MPRSRLAGRYDYDDIGRAARAAYHARQAGVITVPARAARAAGTGLRFTDEEVEILRPRGRGWSYKQIADECHVCEETVRNRIRRIKNKIATLI